VVDGRRHGGDGLGPGSAEDRGAFASVLSFAPPFALVPLILLTRHKDLTGDLVNHQRTHWMAHLPAGIVLALNGLLLYQTFRGSF